MSPGATNNTKNVLLWYGMAAWWLWCHRTILMKNIRQKQFSQFPPVHDFEKPWWGVSMYHVWSITERFMIGWSDGMRPACCFLLNTGMFDGCYPIMVVLTQSYPCDTGFVCSTMRELVVINLGQLLHCLSITWSRCRNVYRDLWIMTINTMPHLCPKQGIHSIEGHGSTCKSK